MKLNSHTHTDTNRPSMLALSSNKTTMGQPLARQTRLTDHFDVRLDTFKYKHMKPEQKRINTVHQLSDVLTGDFILAFF